MRNALVQLPANGSSELDCFFGESPVWIEELGEFFYIDYLGGRVFGYKPGSGTTRRIKCTLEGRFVGLVQTAKHQALLLTEAGLFLLDLISGETRLFGELRGANDGKCDGLGRLWVGARKDGIVYLCRVTNSAIDRFPTMLSSCNGPAFSPDHKRMYISDTARGSIFRYDFDLESGGFSNQQLFAVLKGGIGPDGIACDCEGNVWVCHYGGGQTLCYSPDGTSIKQISLPVPGVTSCTFGARDRKTLFITTSVRRYGNEPVHEPLELSSAPIFSLRCSVAGSSDGRFELAPAR